MLFARYKSQFFPIAGLVASALGFIFSLLMSLGVASETLCLSSGCTIVQDFKIFGISPWWAAAFIFAAISILCFFRLRRAARFLAMLFLAGDCLFLALMIFIAPCSSCLIGALLIFCTWVSLRSDRRIMPTARFIVAGALSAVWFILFLINLGYAAIEALPAWDITASSPQDNKITVYFSPSCPACRETVKLFAAHAHFYPVAENEPDYLIIADLDARIKGGLPIDEALELILAEQKADAYSAPVLSYSSSLFNKIKIMRNQARALRNGDSLPIIVIEGLPDSWARQQSSVNGGEEPYEDQGVSSALLENNNEISAPESPRNGNNNLNEQQNGNISGMPTDETPSAQRDWFMPFFDNTLECGRGDETPCDETEANLAH